MDCLIRIATKADATVISQLIIGTLRHSNAQDYSPDIIDQVENSFSPDAIFRLLAKRQVYVATAGGRVVATASLEANVVRSVFVDPSCQGKGIGKRLMEVIQSVAVTAGVETLRVPSSITAEGFYASLGFRKIRDEMHGAERTVVMAKGLKV